MNTINDNESDNKMSEELLQSARITTSANEIESTETVSNELLESDYDSTEDEETGDSEVDDDDDDEEEEDDGTSIDAADVEGKPEGDEEGEESSSGDDTEGYEYEGGEQSDSSDDPSVADAEKCAICLKRLRDQKIGTPESCDHSFCLDCITEWSKMVNSCPIDRQVFYLIFVRQRIGGDIVQQVTVTDTKPVDSGELLPDNTVCEVCASGSREDCLLLCDGCNLGYHMDCLSPPLSRIPRGDWYCPTCQSITSTVEASESAVAREAESTRRPPSVRRRHQIVARTIVSEQVRARIRRIRMISDSEEDDPSFTGDSNQLIGSLDKPKRAPRKKSLKRKRKSRKRKRKVKRKSKGAKGSTGVKRKRRKKRRLSKKQEARTKTVVKTPKERIAERLSIGLPPQGRFLPTVKEKSGGGGVEIRRLSDTALSTLSVLGNKMELSYFSDSHETECAIVSPSKSRTEGTSSGPSNLLDFILTDQSKLMTDASKVKIQRDGSLSVNVAEKLEKKESAKMPDVNIGVTLEGSVNSSVKNPTVSDDLPSGHDNVHVSAKACDVIVKENDVPTNTETVTSLSPVDRITSELISNNKFERTTEGEGKSAVLLGNLSESSTVVDKIPVSLDNQDTKSIHAAGSDHSGNRDTYTIMKTDMNFSNAAKKNEDGKANVEAVTSALDKDVSCQLTENDSGAVSSSAPTEVAESAESIEEKKRSKKADSSERSRRHRDDDDKDRRRDDSRDRDHRGSKRDDSSESSNRRRHDDDRWARRERDDRSREGDKRDNRRDDRKGEQRSDDRKGEQRSDDRKGEQRIDDRSRDRDRDSRSGSYYRDRDSRRRDRSEERRDSRAGQQSRGRQGAKEVDEFGRIPRSSSSPSPKRSTTPPKANIVPLMSLRFPPKHANEAMHTSARGRDDGNREDAAEPSKRRKRSRWQQDDADDEPVDIKESAPKEPSLPANENRFQQAPPFNLMSGLVSGSSIIRLESMEESPPQSPDMNDQFSHPPPLPLQQLMRPSLPMMLPQGIQLPGSQSLTMAGVAQGHLTLAGAHAPPGLQIAGAQGLSMAGPQNLTGPQGMQMAGLQGMSVGGPQGMSVGGPQGLTMAGAQSVQMAGPQGLPLAGMRPLIVNEQGMPMQAVMLPGGQGMTLVPQNVVAAGLRQPILVNMPLRGPHPLLAGMTPLGMQGHRLVNLLPQGQAMGLRPEGGQLIMNEGGFPAGLGPQMLRPLLHQQAMSNMMSNMASDDDVYMEEDDDFEEEMMRQAEAEAEAGNFDARLQPPNILGFLQQQQQQARPSDMFMSCSNPLVPSSAPVLLRSASQDSSGYRANSMHGRPESAGSNFTEAPLWKQEQYSGKQSATVSHRVDNNIASNTVNMLSEVVRLNELANIRLPPPPINNNNINTRSEISRTNEIANICLPPPNMAHAPPERTNEIANIRLPPPNTAVGSTLSHQLTNIRLPEVSVENKLKSADMPMTNNAQLQSSSIPLPGSKTTDKSTSNDFMLGMNKKSEDRPPTVAEILQRLSNSLPPLTQPMASVAGKSDSVTSSQSKPEVSNIQGQESKVKAAKDAVRAPVPPPPQTNRDTKEMHGVQAPVEIDDGKQHKNDARLHGKKHGHESSGVKSELKKDDTEREKSSLPDDQYTSKLSRQKRVEEEVKLALKPFYNKGEVSKEDYKEIMRKAVPKICHSKSGDINPAKIQEYVAACVTQIQVHKKHGGKKPDEKKQSHKREQGQEHSAQAPKEAIKTSASDKSTKTVTSADVVNFIRNIPLPM